MKVVWVGIESIFIIDSEQAFEHVDVGHVIADKFESAESEAYQEDDEEEGEEGEEHPNADCVLA